MIQENTEKTKGSILIVDDTPANLRLLSNMLAEQGYQVRPVPEGAMALSAAQMSPPDLILLDIKLPGMNGYEVCEKLKADEKTQEIPIIFISALDATDDKIRAFTAGGVDYVTKPFHVEEVLARVETHLALRKLHKRLQDTSEKMARELAIAGDIQTSFLPPELPKLPGWQLSAKLLPASETSGDFFDFMILPTGQLAFLIADVVDKGVGAALFMALCWTLFRTYAVEFPIDPERALRAVNRRILKDTNSNQFVTIFYGILNPKTGTLHYCNAGHCPPYLIKRHNGVTAISLIKTGAPLGISEDEKWERSTLGLESGDAFVLYTDGITEAKNSEEMLFGEERLVESIKRNFASTAKELQEAILNDLKLFMAEDPQLDDIALAVLIRD